MQKKMGNGRKIQIVNSTSISIPKMAGTYHIGIDEFFPELMIIIFVFLHSYKAYIR